MPIRALTIDFWNTMGVAHAGGARRRQQRLAHLRDVVRACGTACPDDAVHNAYQSAVRRFRSAWHEEHRTPTTAEILQDIWTTLDLSVEDPLHSEAVRVFEDGLLHSPPDTADGLTDALRWAAGHYRLGLISDTMFSPGRVLRRLLDERGLLAYFDACVFSDETGFSKPDPRAFEWAARHLDVAPSELAHIGDLRRTDVAGARGVDARSILYTGVRQDEDETPEPHAVLAAWRDLPDVLKSIA